MVLGLNAELAEWGDLVLCVENRPGHTQPWCAVWRRGEVIEWTEAVGGSPEEAGIRAFRRLRLPLERGELRLRQAGRQIAILVEDEWKKKEAEEKRRLEEARRREEQRMTAQEHLVACMPRFRRGTIYLSKQDGTKVPVSAIVAGGLAIHRDARDWSITHVKSGLCVGSIRSTQGYAKLVVSALLLLPIRWEEDQKVVVEQGLPLRSAIRDIFDDAAGGFARIIEGGGGEKR